MPPSKSLDEITIIATALRDVSTNHVELFNTRSLRNTISIVCRRSRSEGMSFLTKTLPRLGKALDKALSSTDPIDVTALRFSTIRGTKLPRFLGELFSRVLCSDGTVLPEPCVLSVSLIRQICYLFYKYELPYSAELEQAVVDSFVKTEDDLLSVSNVLDYMREKLDSLAADTRAFEPDVFRDGSPRPHGRLRSFKLSRGNYLSLDRTEQIVYRARILLERLLCNFDPLDIVPRHGPGVVATKQRLWDKFVFTNVSDRITNVFPLDAYFYASLGHVCDELHTLQAMETKSLPASVILVPKDSRGPRLISCEPVDFQWIQQGIQRELYRHVETHNLTRFNVFFTNQQPNQFGALLGSQLGKYATLDLKEASDRVSVELVRCLFPERLVNALLACRSSATVLPNGKELNLLKFAPMGSALCFPIMALTIWSLLTAAAPDTYTRERILVYGDDVIVPTAFAADAITCLESVGLLVNRNKSCTKGFFRESCGTDAYKGTNVTPLRLRTVWTPHPSASSFESWLAYANGFYKRKFFGTYDYIVGCMSRLYRDIPDASMNLSCPSLPEAPPHQYPVKRKICRNTQRVLRRVLVTESVQLKHHLPGWLKLLRYFTEAGRAASSGKTTVAHLAEPFVVPFDASVYTKRRTSILVRRWR